jgi:hypothetical protein
MRQNNRDFNESAMGGAGREPARALNIQGAYKASDYSNLPVGN